AIALAGTEYVLCKTTGTDFSTGQTVNIRTSGTTSPLNVFGLITRNNGLTISAGNTSVVALSASDVITANAGIIAANGQTVSVGTSGSTSALNVFGRAAMF